MKKSFYKDYIILALPIILQTVLTSLISAGDAIMLGRVGPLQMSAVALAGQIGIIYLNILVSGGIATSALAAQYYGNGDEETVSRIMYLSLKIFLLFGLGFFLAGSLFPYQIMKLLTNDPTVGRLGASYLQIMSFTYMPMAFCQIYLTILKNTGHPGIGALIGGITAISNLFFNYVFIFGHLGMPALEVRGAAIGSVLAQFLQISLIFLAMRLVKAMPYSYKGLLINYQFLRPKFLRYSIPAVSQITIWSLAQSVLISILAHLGNDVIAAHAVGIVVFNVIGPAADGMGVATSIHIGHELGSNELEQAKVDAKKSILLSYLLGLIMGAIILLLRPFAWRFSPNLSKVSRDYLDFMMIVLAVKCLSKAPMANSSRGFLSAGGDVRFLIVLDALNMWAVIVPLSALAAYYLHLPPKIVYVIINLDEFTKFYIQMRRVFSWSWVINLTRKDWALPGHYVNEVREKILEQLPAGVLVIGSYGRIIYSNLAVQSILGYSADEMEGLKLLQVFLNNNDKDSDDFVNLLLDALYKQSPIKETKIHYKKGEDISKDIYVSTILVEEEDMRIGICALITEAQNKQALT